MILNYGKTAQNSKSEYYAQREHRIYPNYYGPEYTIGAGPVVTGVTQYPTVNHVGVPATMADVCSFHMPPGINGRVIAVGVSFIFDGFHDDGWAGGDTAGTILFQQIVPGAAALATCATLTLPQAVPAVQAPNNSEVVQPTVTIAPAAAPWNFVGGELFVAYTSVARVIAAGDIHGGYIPWMDIIIDGIAQEARAACFAYLLAR